MAGPRIKSAFTRKVDKLCRDGGLSARQFAEAAGIKVDGTYHKQRMSNMRSCDGTISEEEYKKLCSKYTELKKTPPKKFLTLAGPNKRTNGGELQDIREVLQQSTTIASAGKRYAKIKCLQPLLLGAMLKEQNVRSLLRYAVENKLSAQDLLSLEV